MTRGARWAWALCIAFTWLAALLGGLGLGI